MGVSLLVLEHRPDLLAELRGVLVSVRVHRMPDRDREHFLLFQGRLTNLDNRDTKGSPQYNIYYFDIVVRGEMV